MSIMNPLDIAVAILKSITETEKSVEPKPGQPRAEFLREEIRRLRKQRERLAHLTKVYLILGSAILIVSIGFYISTKRVECWIGAGYGALFLFVPFVRSSRSFDTDILSLESELDLIETTEVMPEQRAEKLFKHHQYELQKYYDQTLRHSKWIFVVGVLCIFVGFGIVATTFFLVAKPMVDTAFQEKILISVFGAVGGILANFIAVIYLRMFSEILKSVTDFHNRLVATHNLYFANFMITKVGESSVRDGVVSEIAKNLIKT